MPLDFNDFHIKNAKKPNKEKRIEMHKFQELLTSLYN